MLVHKLSLPKRAKKIVQNKWTVLSPQGSSDDKKLFAVTDYGLVYLVSTSLS